MFVFDSSLETGNAVIDTEHKTLIKAINDLLEACKSGRGRDSLAETMRFLTNYTVQHFSHEEQLQKQSGYPDLVRHHQLHEAFKRTVQSLAAELNSTGPNIALVGKVNMQIGDWLVNHIKREDTKVAAHIKSKKSTH